MGEIVFIENNSDKMTVEMMSRRIDRTAPAIKQKMSRLHIRGVLPTMEYLTNFQIRNMLGVQNSTILRWEKRGLKMRRIGHFRTYKQEDLVKFLQTHQDVWNAAKVKDDTLFMGKQWYTDKRRKDQETKRPYFWTRDELNLLKEIRYKDIPIKEMAEATHHSVPGVKAKMKQLRMQERKRRHDNTQGTGVTNENTNP